MRGDRPVYLTAFEMGWEFTPHARGSTPRDEGGDSIAKVYPACAGIDRIMIGSANDNRSLPRMRGDRPSSELVLNLVY